MYAHSEARARKRDSGVGTYIWGVPSGTPLLFTIMRKYIACIILITAIFISSAGAVCAQESDSSAVLKSKAVNDGFDYRVQNLTRFFQKYNSPLTPYASDFVAYADMYDIDYRLVPAISGVESTFGKQIPYNSYNAYGWANGNYSFKSWPDSIETVSKTLRTNYMDRGAVSIGRIARIYAPPSTTWAGKVQYFVNKIDPFPLSFDI